PHQGDPLAGTGRSHRGELPPPLSGRLTLSLIGSYPLIWTKKAATQLDRFVAAFFFFVFRF
ncbi:MAG: hypothetical protein IIY82_04155, partial [Firmicutes bacterium]|nr:hypothetical protein [Bacillota bacterium]